MASDGLCKIAAQESEARGTVLCTDLRRARDLAWPGEAPGVAGGQEGDMQCSPWPPDMSIETT